MTQTCGVVERSVAFLDSWPCGFSFLSLAALRPFRQSQLGALRATTMEE